MFLMSVLEFHLLFFVSTPDFGNCFSALFGLRISVSSASTIVNPVLFHGISVLYIEKWVNLVGHREMGQLSRSLPVRPTSRRAACERCDALWRRVAVISVPHQVAERLEPSDDSSGPSLVDYTEKRSLPISIPDYQSHDSERDRYVVRTLTTSYSSTKNIA